MPAAASGRWSRSTQATDHGAENGPVHAYVQDAALPAAESSSAARAARCCLGSCAFASALPWPPLPACPGPTARGTLDSVPGQALAITAGRTPHCISLVRGSPFVCLSCSQAILRLY